MISDAFGAGLMAALGLLVTFWKCPWKLRIIILSHPVKADLAISALMFFFHGGTLTGGFAAAGAALFCSIALSLLRWLFGYNERNPVTRKLTYIKGLFDKSNAIYPPPPPNHPDFL